MASRKCETELLHFVLEAEYEYTNSLMKVEQRGFVIRHKYFLEVEKTVSSGYKIV